MNGLYILAYQVLKRPTGGHEAGLLVQLQLAKSICIPKQVEHGRPGNFGLNSDRQVPEDHPADPRCSPQFQTLGQVQDFQPTHVC